MTVRIKTYTTEIPDLILPYDVLTRIEGLIDERLGNWPDDEWFEIEAMDGLFWDLNLWKFDDPDEGEQRIATLYPVKVVNRIHSTETNWLKIIELNWEEF